MTRNTFIFNFSATGGRICTSPTSDAEGGKSGHEMRSLPGRVQGDGAGHRGEREIQGGEPRREWRLARPSAFILWRRSGHPAGRHYHAHKAATGKVPARHPVLGRSYAAYPVLGSVPQWVNDLQASQLYIWNAVAIQLQHELGVIRDAYNAIAERKKGWVAGGLDEKHAEQ